MLREISPRELWLLKGLLEISERYNVETVFYLAAFNLFFSFFFLFLIVHRILSTTVNLTRLFRIIRTHAVSCVSCRVSRNSLEDRANCASAKTGRAPYEHCRFRELKFSIRKYVIVVSCASETTAKEIEETDIPWISIDRKRPPIPAAITDFFIDNRDSVTSPRESYGPTGFSFLFARHRT